MNHREPATSVLYDGWLLFTVSFLILMGLLMVASASMAISTRIHGYPLYFLWHQCLHVVMGVALAFLIVRIPLHYWSRFSASLLVVAFFLLFMVLLPGVGVQVKGSARWLYTGIFLFQVSEFVKLAMVVYMAGYLVRRCDEVRSAWVGFIKPLILVAVIVMLLLMEPDFGAGAVILMVTLSMLFIAGVRLNQFLLLLFFSLICLAVLAVSAPYRIHRMTSFLNPWATEFGGGYQLTQSLIAFGRGGFFGVGLGNSIQKLFYLPESHTDFLFAVLAEELGFIGVALVMLCYSLFVRGVRYI